jgi:hypothetical protein
MSLRAIWNQSSAVKLFSKQAPQTLEEVTHGYRRKKAPENARRQTWGLDSVDRHTPKHCAAGLELTL